MRSQSGAPDVRVGMPKGRAEGQVRWAGGGQVRMHMHTRLCAVYENAWVRHMHMHMHMHMPTLMIVHKHMHMHTPTPMIVHIPIRTHARGIRICTRTKNTHMHLRSI
jgi:hypothetical protein